VKRILFFLFFINIFSNTNGEDLFKFYWNFGSIGLGMNYSSNENDNLELTVSVLNFVFEQDYSGFGFEVNPLKYKHIIFFNEEQKDKISFLNINTYYDFFENKNIILGPFSSINYFFLNTSAGFNIYEYIASSGLRFSLRSNNVSFYNKFNKYNLQMDFEIGYRNIMRDNKFYISITGDLIGMLYLIYYYKYPY